MSNSVRPHRRQPTRLPRPWDSPGKNTGVGCHFLLQGIFPAQTLNLGLLHCRQILYHLGHQGVSFSVFLFCCNTRMSDYPSSIKLLLHFYQKLLDHTFVGLFLDSILFHCSVCLYLLSSATQNWLLQLCNKSGNWVVWDFLLSFLFESSIFFSI